MPLDKKFFGGEIRKKVAWILVLMLGFDFVNVFSVSDIYRQGSNLVCCYPELLKDKGTGPLVN